MPKVTLSFQRGKGELRSGCGQKCTMEGDIAHNVQRETTFPQGMSRRQAAPALPPGAEA